MDSARNSARQRILDAASELFGREGINAVGVDTIAARSGAAKMTLYRHFKSKEALILEVLQAREASWTREWLEKSIEDVPGGPEERLLGVFDAFDSWFRKIDFEGCTFINTLLETREVLQLRQASAQHLANIRSILERLAREAGLLDVERFARTWHILMKGSIVARHEGQLDAALEAKACARVLMENWPRLKNKDRKVKGKAAVTS